MAPNIPSITHIVDVVRATILRFPLTLILAVIANILIILLIQDESDINPLGRFALVSVLGISLSFAFQLRADYDGWTAGKKWLAALLPLSLLANYLVTLPPDIDALFDNVYHSYRFAMIFVVSHLLVAFLPTRNTFWEFNKTLFIRILLGALYSFVLFAGLSIAILSLDMLFGIDFGYKIYSYLWVTVAFTFNTLFFLSGVPSKSELDQEQTYPKGLRVFTQYLLIPIVLLYGLILYAYMGKILIQWSWPEGWVTWLVICYSISGIFAFLLVHPLMVDADQPWVRLFSKLYFPALLPLSILQLAAVWERISAYGITENRYLAMLTGLWLISVIVVLIRSRATQIRYIPISLAALIIAVMFGPWGMFSVSKSSQRGQLDQVLMEAGITDRPIQPASLIALDSVSTERFMDITQYLLYTHNVEALNGFIADSTLAMLDTKHDNRWNMHGELMTFLGVSRSKHNQPYRLVNVIQETDAIPTYGYAFVRRWGGWNDIRINGTVLDYDRAENRITFGDEVVELTDFGKVAASNVVVSIEMATFTLTDIRIVLAEFELNGDRLSNPMFIVYTNQDME